MFKKLYKKLKGLQLTMRAKIILSLSAIAVILLISSILSVMEYTSMSHYVSDLIAGNIRSINVAQQLANTSNEYNLELLTIIGDDTKNNLPNFDQDAFMNRCDSLRQALRHKGMSHLADSVEYSYSAYMLTSLELPKVLESDFIDTRTWYFERLQPVFNKLTGDIDNLTSAIYKELSHNSATFDRGFYRSIIPSAVAVAVCLLLVLLLMYFLLADFVNPIYKMISGIKNYRAVGKKYNVEIDGDGQMAELSEGISDLTEENIQLKHYKKIEKRNNQQ